MNIPSYTSSESEPHARGFAFGRAHASAVATTVGTYLQIFNADRGLSPDDVAARGGIIAQQIAGFRPALADEIIGIAAGAGQPPELVFAVNGRTELLAGGAMVSSTGGECSTVAVINDDGALLAQNWDFHPDLAKSRVLWTITDTEKASWRTTFTEAGVVGKIGVNSFGVGLAINFLASGTDGGVQGVPVHVLCRAVIDESETVEGARELISRTPLAASICMTVAGTSSAGGTRALALERWPGGVSELGEQSAGAWIAHTNHFLAAVSVGDALVGGAGGDSSRQRLLKMIRHLEAGEVQTMAQLADLLSSEAGDGTEPLFRVSDIDQPWLTQCATLATIGFELPQGRIWLRDVLNSRAPVELVAG